MEQTLTPSSLLTDTSVGHTAEWALDFRGNAIIRIFYSIIVCKETKTGQVARLKTGVGSGRGVTKLNNSRGLSLTNKDTWQRQLERGLHHFDRERLQRQRQVNLGRRRTGKALEVDVSGRQHLTVTFVLLYMINNQKIIILEALSTMLFYYYTDTKLSHTLKVKFWNQTTLASSKRFNSLVRKQRNTYTLNDKCPFFVFKLISIGFLNRRTQIYLDTYVKNPS